MWAQVADKIKELPLVAHNRPFDESCLKAAFAESDKEYPDYVFYYTFAVSRRCLGIPSHQFQRSAAAWIGAMLLGRRLSLALKELWDITKKSSDEIFPE